MLVDVAPHQQMIEVFGTNHNHHRSSSSSSTSSSSSSTPSSLTHRRNITTTLNPTSSSASNNQSTAMNNGYSTMSDELSKKAEKILGHATDLFPYHQQMSFDAYNPNQLRLDTEKIEPTLTTRNVTLNNSSAPISVNSASSSSPSSPTKTFVSDNNTGKNRREVTSDQLLPLIFQLVAAPDFEKLGAIIPQEPLNSKPTENIQQSREMTTFLHRTSYLQLSDDENEDEDDEKINNNNTNSVLMDSNQKNDENNSINQTNSNDNPSASSVIHPDENQIETQHSGRTSSRCEEDDSDDEDSDNKEAAHSDAENEDQNNATNPNTISLLYFISQSEPFSEPVNASLKCSPESSLANKKRSISPDIKADHDNHVHNSEDHQNKRQKILMKRSLLKSFGSSVNMKIDLKQPSLPISIPTHLLLEQSNDEPINERILKRDASGAFKIETNTDTNDGLGQSSSSNSALLNNNQTIVHQKKNKTSHSNEKTSCKHDSPTVISTAIKNETNSMISNGSTNNETDNRLRPSLTSTSHTAIVSPVTNLQPKKEKPTANVRPLQQSATIDNLSSINSFNNGANASDNLTTNSTRSMLPTTKLNYAKLKNMSTNELALLARNKKKQADNSKRANFSEAREAMSLYLESVCYFIQCANDESKFDQRIGLLSTTLNMLQQLVCNQQKLFHISNQSGDTLSNIRQKFLVINYWLQSLICHLQFNTSMPMIERSANQVAEYFHQLKNPSSAASLSKTTTTTTNSSQSQTTPINDSNPISPLSVASQTSASDSSTTSSNTQVEQHRFIYDFSKSMLHSYNSTYYWNKAERLSRDKSLKEFTEQLRKQNQNRRLSRDDPTIDFLLYMFDAIELLRVSVA